MKIPPRRILKYYFLRLFSGLFFTYVIQSIFLLSRGITPAQLALYASLTIVFATLLEIPTGFIADRFGRKVSVSLSYLCGGLAFIGFIFVHDLASLAVVACLRGLSSALSSGALEALVYDELQDAAPGTSFLRLTSQGSTLAITAAAFGSFVSPIMYIANPLVPFLLSGLVSFGTAIYVLSFDEQKRSGEVLRNTKLIDGVKKVVTIRPILLIVLVDMLLLIFVNIYYQVLFFPKINALGLDLQYLGVLDVITLAITSVFLYLISRVFFKNDKITLIVYTLAPALAFVLFGLSNTLVFALIFGALFDPLWNMRTHVVPTITNQYFESRNRALNLSSMMFLSSLGAAVLLPLTMLFLNTSYLFTLVPLLGIIALLVFYPGEGASANQA